jgi:chromosome segregation ATPase
MDSLGLQSTAFAKDAAAAQDAVKRLGREVASLEEKNAVLLQNNNESADHAAVLMQALGKQEQLEKTLGAAEEAAALQQEEIRRLEKEAAEGRARIEIFQAALDQASRQQQRLAQELQESRSRCEDLASEAKDSRAAADEAAAALSREQQSAVIVQQERSRLAALVDTAVHGRALHDRQKHPGGAYGANRSCVVQ